MSVTVAEGEVVFTADTARLSSGLNSGIDSAASSAEGHGSRAGKFLGGALKVGLGAALAGAGGIAAILKTGFDEASDASAGNAQLAAGIKSTGNAAGVTVASLNKMAGALQNSTGQTDDSITAAQSLLLTFTNINNNGPDKIFDKATVAAADMAARMGGDASSNAILLGKALNDPAKGITRLTKVGVTFSDQQKAQIAQMTKVGDTAGAQGVILAELGKEFGGSAKAAGESFPGVLQRLRRSFEDFSQGAVQSLVPVLIPAFDKIIGGIQSITPWVSGLGPKIQTAMSSIDLGAIGGMFTPILTAIQPLIPLVVQFAQAVSPVGLVLQALGPQLVPLVTALVGLGVALLTAILPAITQVSTIFVSFLSTALLPIVAGIMNLSAFLTPLAPVLASVAVAVGAGVIAWRLFTGAMMIWRAATAAGIVIQGIFNAVMTANPIGIVIVAIAALVAGLVFFFTKTKVGQAAWRAFTGFLVSAFNSAKAGISAAFNAIGGFISGFIAKASAMAAAVGSAIGRVVGFFTGLRSKILNAVAYAAGLLVGIGKNMVDGLVNGIKDKIAGVASTLIAGVSGAVSSVKNFLGIKSPSRVFMALGRYVTQGFAIGITGSTSQIKSAMQSLANRTIDAYNTVSKDKKRAITKAQSDFIGQVIGANSAYLVKVSAQQDAVVNKLKTANKNLNSLLKEAATYKAGILSSLTKLDPTQSQNAADYTQNLLDQVTQTKLLTTTLASLRKKGLDSTTYQALVAKGLDALPIAQSILSSGKTGIKAIGKLQGQLSSASGTLAQTATSDMYGAGVAAAKGIVKGLESQKSALSKTMKSIAKDMVSSIKAELGIHSPSRVMHNEVGVMMGRGISGGLAAEIPNIRRGVVQGLATATNGVGVQVGSNTGGASVSTNRTVNYTIVEANDPMGTLGRIAAADRRWGSRKS